MDDVNDDEENLKENCAIIMLASVELDTEWERFSRKKSGQISSTADIYIQQHSAC